MEAELGFAHCKDEFNVPSQGFQKQSLTPAVALENYKNDLVLSKLCECDIFRMCEVTDDYRFLNRRHSISHRLS